MDKVILNIKSSFSRGLNLLNLEDELSCKVGFRVELYTENKEIYVRVRRGRGYGLIGLKGGLSINSYMLKEKLILLKRIEESIPYDYLNQKDLVICLSNVALLSYSTNEILQHIEEV